MLRIVLGLAATLIAASALVALNNGLGEVGTAEYDFTMDHLATMIELDLAKQDAPGIDLSCDDPGSVDDGDITYCRGAAAEGEKITVKVTFDDGGYSWENL